MVLFLAGISDSEVDDGPVRAGIIVLGRPERARCVSDRQSSPDNSRGIILCQHLGSVGFVAAIKVQVETVFDRRLDEIHVGSDEVRHGYGFFEGVLVDVLIRVVIEVEIFR